MHITQLSAELALAGMRTTAAGLRPPEAARRLAEYGPNRIERLAGEPAWRLGLRQFTHFFAVLLLAAAGLAFFSETQAPAEGMATLGWAILGVVLINGAFAGWQEHRAERAIDALRAMMPRRAVVRRDGATVTVDAETVVPGDVLLLREGDDVPADCRIIECHGQVRVNLATLTGESRPQARGAGAAATEDVLSSRNVLLAGTAVLSGAAAAVVFATGMRTEFGRIAHLAQSQRDTVSPLQREIGRLSRVIALLATVLGVVFFALGQAMGLGFWASMLFAIGIIVANVPEGLLPTVTLSLAMATQRMARRNALIRHLPAAEALGATTVIVTDKTGTLTENRMQAVETWFPGGGPQLAGMSSAETQARAEFFQAALQCHGLRDEGRGPLLGDPTEIALVEMADRFGGRPARLERVDEITFDSDRRRMSTVHRDQAGRVLYCKGALDAVLPLCTGALTVSAASERSAVPMAAALRAETQRAEVEMAERGLRVLALACRRLPPDAPREEWECGLMLTGLVGLHDPPRPEVAGALATCREAGIRVIMVTGDHPRTASAVARRIGLDDADVMTGGTLARISDAQLQLALEDGDILFARVTAEQKLRVVAALQRKGHVVAVTGDGVNDAPALRRADIGIAMGRVGTDVARGAADMVLLDDNFASIVAAIEEGRAVFQNIRKFLAYILTSNVPEIVPYLAFVLFRIPLPLTVIQILAVDLGTDMLPALALGGERPAADTMRRPPRRRDERLVNGALLARAYLWLGPMQAAAAMAAFLFVLQAGGWEYGDLRGAQDPLYRQATTACLAAIVVMQMANVFLCRDERASLVVMPAANPLIYAGLAFEFALILAIVYTPLGNAAAGTAPLEAVHWLFMLPFVAVMVLLEEARKKAARTTQRTWRPGPQVS